MRCEGKKLAQVARCQARGLLEIPGSDNDDDHDVQATHVDDAAAAFGLCLAAQDADEGDEIPTTAADGQADQPQARQGAGPRVYLWPCNLATFNAWQRVQTQWQHDASGKPTGLQYAGVMPFLARVLRLKPKAFDEIFSGLQAMERAALGVWREQRD